MASATDTPELERLFATARARAQRRANGRERAVEAGMAISFLLVALAMALFINSPRTLEAGPVFCLIVVYVIACRAQFEIADGYTVPTELVLVPMLFLLPTPVVPLLVSVSWVLGRLIDYASGATSVYRAFHVFGDCWHAVGPALVLIVAGAQVFSWDDWPIYVVALLAQFGFDYGATSLRAGLIDGTSARESLRLMAPVYGLDGALAPIGLFATVAAISVGPVVTILVIPLAGVLTVLSHERQTRIGQALELSEAYQGTALLLGDVVEADDAYTGSHSRGVVELSLGVADKLGLDLRQMRDVEFAALLHDVGKIAVPKEIINKDGPLTDDEWLVIKTHTIEGQRMLDRVGGLLSDVGRIVRSSHEKWDGSGYPDGLIGDAIPVESAIVACCDAFNAMTTDRSYRAAMSLQEAIDELTVNSGTQFSPAVVDALLLILTADPLALGARGPRVAAVA